MAKTKKSNPEPAKITDEVSDAEVIVQNDETSVEETDESIAAEVEPEIDPVADPEIDPETLHDEDHPVSIAARSLQILAFLAVGAGIGIWAAPKIAPLLPAGMAPIAQWLSPSNNAAIEDVEQLRLDLETRLAALETLPTRAEIETRL
ncbi:MAG: hypothetical protein L3J02_07615, partial [Henriciella sp.]|nr:hypothetical protein [Henriciella sp.]